MPQPHSVIVVNPTSQSGRLGKQWSSLSQRLRRHFAFDHVFTDAPGDATRLTTQALRSGAHRVIAIGGDGTINEVVNGFFDDGKPIASQAALGVIPFGTGGDFRKSMQLSTNIDRAAEVLAQDKQRTIDVGRVEFHTRDGEQAARMFINIASFGISGLVDRYVNESSKKLGGRLSFMMATVRAGIHYKNQRVRLVFNDDPDTGTEVIMQTVAVANGGYFGGGMYIAPHAQLDDGEFDVVAVGDMSLKDMLIHGRRLYKGTHLSHDKINCRRATSLRAENLEGVVELDIDGETPGILPARFSVIPKGLRVVFP